MPEQSVTLRRVQAQGQEIEYRLERKAVKNWNLRIRRDGSVYLSAPRRTPVSELDDFVRSKAGYIQKARERFRAVEDRPVLHDESIFQEILDQCWPLLEPYGVAYPHLRLREMKSRWGSCLVYKQTITLNTKLLTCSRECIEYVVLHELCHFIHPNHSPRFYALLASFLPDWKARRQALNEGPGSPSQKTQDAAILLTGKSKG